MADIAELIVALKLRDGLSSGLGRLNSQLSGLDRNVSGLNTRVSRAGQVINTALGVGLERVVSSGIRGLVGSIQTGVQEMQRLEDANLQTQAALASTDGASGQTAKGIRQMAEAYEAVNATVDDKAIQEAANKLLTFTGIQGDVFKDALEASLDLSTRMDGDVQGAILQVGKALQDPIGGVTALKKAGVQLNDQQRAQIKTLVEQNRLYDAQQIILGELNTQVGGSFAAQGQGDAARAAALRDRIEDLQRVLAEGLSPGLTRVREGLIEAFDNPQVIAGVRNVGDNIANFLSAENLRTAGDAARDVFEFLGDVPWGTIGEGLKITGAATKGVVDAFLRLPKEVQGIVVAGLAVNKLSGGIAGSLAAEGIKAIVSGLRTVTAANVTVIGKSVIGGPNLPVDPTKTGPGNKGPGNLLGNAWKVIPPLFVASLASEFSDEIIGFGVGLRADLAKTLNIDLPTWSAADFDWPFGTRNTPRLPGPDWFADILGGIEAVVPRTPKKTGSRSAGAMDLGAQDRTYQAEDRRPVAAVLPDTAMAPVVAGVATVNTSVQTLAPILKGSDTILRTGLNANTAEVARNRTETSTRLLALSGNYAGTNARLDRSNASLATIAAKNPAINLTNINNIRLSPTVIHQRIVQQNVISGFTSNDNSAGI